MRTRTAGIAFILVLLASTSAAGESALVVPKKVQIKDPAGDANFLNGQGNDLPLEGDISTPVDLAVPDILAVWFTHDAKTISAHIQTEAPPPATEGAYNFMVGVNPSDAHHLGRCLLFDSVVEGPTHEGDAFARVVRCRNPGDRVVKGKLTVTEAVDGTGITTMTVPRSSDPAFADGQILEAPRAWTVHWTGRNENNELIFAAILFADDTKPGKDYVITKR
jgi:hypothetical protein